MIEVAHEKFGGSSHSNHHPAKFGDLVPCESEEKKIFDLPCDHTIKVSRDFADGYPSC